jgi:hypothetical protein
MIIPFGTALGPGRPPFVTVTIMLLCLIIHHFQVNNRAAIDAAAERYCAAIHDPHSREDARDYLTVDQAVCRDDLAVLHSLPDASLIGEYYSGNEAPGGNFEAFLATVRQHMQVFARAAPASLDRMLSYDPASFNPVTSLTPALAHASWWHVIGNLVFFLAFTPAVELLVEEGVHRTVVPGHPEASSLRAKYQYSRNIRDGSGCGEDVTSFIYLLGARDHFIKIRATIAMRQAGSEDRVLKFVDQIVAEMLR